MNKLHYAARSVNVLNGLLFLAVATVGYDVISPFVNVTIQTNLPVIAKTEIEAENQPAALPIPSFADYIVISEQNLFHPERKMTQDKKGENDKAAAVPKPDLVLSGTLITGDVSIAYLEDRKAPYATPGRGTRPRSLKKGESIGGYVLRDIEPNRVVLVRGEDQVVVMLDEKNKRRGMEAASPSGGLPTRAATLGTAAPLAASGRRDLGASPAGGSQATTQATAASPATGSSAASALPASPTAATDASAASAPALPTPSGSPGMQNLPPRSRALSEMLTTTPAGVRRALQGK